MVVLAGDSTDYSEIGLTGGTVTVAPNSFYTDPSGVANTFSDTGASGFSTSTYNWIATGALTDVAIAPGGNTWAIDLGTNPSSPLDFGTPSDNLTIVGIAGTGGTNPSFPDFVPDSIIIRRVDDAATVLDYVYFKNPANGVVALFDLNAFETITFEPPGGGGFTTYSNTGIDMGLTAMGIPTVTFADITEYSATTVAAAETFAGVTGPTTPPSTDPGSTDGTDLSDLLTGLDTLDDILNGLGGNDTLLGGGGNDTINGGTGNDSIDGGDGTDEANGNTGNDTLCGGSGNDTLLGGQGDDTINGKGGEDDVRGNKGNDDVRGGRGNDTITGNEGDDLVRGDLGDDSLNGNQGRDNVNGNGGDDRVLGGQDADTVRGGADNDFVNGNKGTDVARGDKGNDTVRGGADNDTVDGGAGDDTIFGDRGNDLLTGGTDTDTFAFRADSGNDTITDFVNGQDEIELGGISGITSFSDLTLTQSGSNVSIDLGGGNSILVENVTTGDFSASDFSFV